MKKIKLMLLIISLVVFSFAGMTSASPSTQTEVELTTEVYTNIHNTVVEGNYASLTNDGQLVISTTARDINIEENLFNKYLENINILNNTIRTGGVWFDSNFNLQFAPTDEITQIIYEKDQQTEQFNNIIVPFADPGAPPFLHAYTIANNNYLEMKTTWEALALGIGGNATAATSYTLSFWVAKVKPGGAWDYKVVTGYKPYNKQWRAIVRGGTENRTSEWFGNYNYGYTGKFLFSLNTLYTGGDVVSKITGGAPDDFEDRTSIAQGYNDNY